MIYLEYLNIKSLFYVIFFLKKKNKNIVYIYNRPNSRFIKKIYNFFGFSVEQLSFKMVDIREENGELSKLKINNTHLFHLEKNLLKNLNFKKFFNNNNPYLKNYFQKKIISESFFNKNSIARTIYLFDVITGVTNNNKNIIFLIKNRPFFELLYNYVKIKYKKKLKVINLYNLSFYNHFYNYFYITINILRYFAYSLFKIKSNFSKVKTNINLYCVGENHPNLFEKDVRSDFFWQIDIKFPIKNIVYNTSDKQKHLYLSKYINSTFNFNADYKFTDISYNINFKKLLNFNSDFSYINSHISDYKFQKFKLFNYLKSNKVKLSISWYKYDEKQILLSECLNELGGISTIWQMAFDGSPMYECKTLADINFVNSKFSANIDKKNQSIFNFNVVTGLPNVKISNYMKQQSNELRKYFHKQGVEKIVCVLDENSLSDDRWHTGHNYQIDNYSKIITELLNNKKLGIIFKPKVPNSLRDRLGESYNLIEEAKRTKRCFIYDEQDAILRRSTIFPFVAGLSADLVIHSDLSAGTAAIECAYHNIPTILLDRERNKSSIFHDLNSKNIIFNEWDDIIVTIRNLISNNIDIKNIGNWKDDIKKFKSFDDNLANERIGNFLKDIIYNFNKGYKKNTILEIVSSNYANKWGRDKIIY